MDHKEITECRKILYEEYDHEAVQEARLLLGSDYDHLSDQQIHDMVKRLKVLAKIALDIAMRNIEDKRGQKIDN